MIGETLIKKYEGCKLTAYLCPMKVWTIGYGNTSYEDGSKIKEGDAITQDRAEELLSNYLEKNVYPVFDKLPKLNNSQKEAICSLVYNWNMAGFLNSNLFIAIKANNYSEIIKQWDYGFKNNLLGLFKRRTEELYFFFKDIE